MQLLLIRHAIAEPAGVLARTDDTEVQRPLTEDARRKMRKAANRLRSQIERIDVLACSSLRRARETAEIIARAFGASTILERHDLAPGSDPESLLFWLRKRPADATVALVGHEPCLGLLAGMFLAGIRRLVLSLKKGGVALIDFPTRAEPGAGVLQWALSPAQLRSLKD